MISVPYISDHTRISEAAVYVFLEAASLVVILSDIMKKALSESGGVDGVGTNRMPASAAVGRLRSRMGSVRRSAQPSEDGGLTSSQKRMLVY